jgi:hypothetical protein
MTTRLIVAIVSLACVSICALVATVANSEIVEKVNSRLTKEEQFAPVGWYWSKFQRLHREYQRLFPDGRLLFKFWVAMVLMFAGLIVCSWGIGLFAK